MMFNWKSFLLMCLSSSLLISCAGREKHSSDHLVDFTVSNAPFIIEQIVKSPNTAKSISIIYKGGLADSFIVNLSTCLKDSIRKDNPIQDTPFTVEYQNDINSTKKEIIKVTSDVNGCILWQERYPYKYIVKPIWLLLKRTIKKEKGAYAGQIEIPLAINPWLVSSEDSRFSEILDLRPLYSQQHIIFKDHPYKRNGLEFLSKYTNQKEYPQLWAPKIDMQIETQLEQTKVPVQNIKQLIKKYQTICKKENNNDCYTRDLKVNLTIPIKLRSYSLQRDLVDQGINGGSYDISIQLLANTDVDSKDYRIHENICTKPISISEAGEGQWQGTKFISVSCLIPVSYFNQNAKYKMVVSIEPDKTLPFKKFEGVYTVDLFQAINIGTVHSYYIDSTLDEHYKHLPEKIDIIKKMNIQYIYDAIKVLSQKESLNDTETVKLLNSLGFYPVYLDVQLNWMKFSEVENNESCSSNETVVQRTVRFIGEACIKDVLTGHKYKKTNFRIFIEDLNSGEIREAFSDTLKKTISTTNAEGCISWFDSITHNNFDRQQYYLRKMHFLSEELDLYGTYLVGLNPWQRAFQAYQNINQLSVREIRTSSKGIDKPEMVINHFKSVNLFPSYVLDKLLNIHIFQNIYFLFQPRIKRPDNVSLGREHKSTELIRDGYYLLRILIFRNPQETEDIPRVISPDEKERILSETNNEKQTVHIARGRYLTHIDTVIKAEANFNNIYMPLYFTQKQLFYLASRNLISIQVIPADPSKFHYKPLTQERTTCEVDFEKTEWKPFFSHDLITKPYVGAFTAQTWTNWNVLRASPHLDTDKIIEDHPTGRKYKFFNLMHKNQSQPVQPQNIPIVNLEKECSNQEDLDNFDTEKCSSINSRKPEVNPILMNRGDRHAKTVQAFYENKPNLFDTKTALQNFSKDNALKVVDIFSPQGDKFIQDLKDLDDIIEILDIDLPYSMDSLLDLITDSAMKGELSFRFRNECYTASIFGFRFFLNKDCAAKVLEEYVEENLYKQKNGQFAFQPKDYDVQVTEDEDSPAVQDQKFDNYIRLSERNASLSHFINKLDKNGDTFLSSSTLSQKVLKDIVDEGISDHNKEDLNILYFAKSMCGFWFQSFFDKYLDAEQMRTAFTDYITKYDYYRVLESNSESEIYKTNFLTQFLDVIDNKDVGLKKCHRKYAQCILVDHCKLRDHNGKKQQSYCHRVSNWDDESCKQILDEECSQGSDIALCQRSVPKYACHKNINDFCNINVDHRICQSYSSRCLRNYYSCTDDKNVEQSLLDTLFAEKMNPFEDKDSDEIFNIDNFVDNKTDFIKSCLRNPFEFFQFENKMFIDKLAKPNPKYIGGFAGNFSINANFSIGSYLNWTSQRGSSFSIKSDFFTGLLKLLPLGLDISKGVSANTSHSARRAVDIRVGEGAYLIASRATMDIPVEKFKKCLSIKPSSTAFFGYLEDGLWKAFGESVWTDKVRNHLYKKYYISKPGLLLCNQMEDRKAFPEIIRESYYYIFQSLADPNSSPFLNLYDLANRPFMIVLRGKGEFFKFYNLMKITMEGESGDINDNASVSSMPRNMFVKYPTPVEEAISMSLTLREFNATGFHPGVYNYNDTRIDLNPSFIKQSDTTSNLFKAFDGNLNLPIPEVTNIPTPIYDF